MESLLYGHGWEGLQDDNLLIKVARAHCVGNGWELACGTVASAPMWSPSQDMECLDPAAATRDHNLGAFNDRILFSGF